MSKSSRSTSTGTKPTIGTGPSPADGKFLSRRDSIGWTRRIAEGLAVILHRHFLALLIAAYALAALLPGLGQHLRHLTLGEVAVAGDQVTLSVPFILLAFLLLNAGLGAEKSEIRS